MNIVLIGYMGTGKSAVGKKLAAAKDMKFIETDDLIVELAGKTIPKIFEEEGEIAFREKEMAVVKGLEDIDNAVISTGGGIVVNKINIDRLKQNGKIVLLTAKVITILRRTSGDKNRPLLQTEDPKAKIEKMLADRKLLYSSSADITVATDTKTHKQVIDEINEKISAEE